MLSLARFTLPWLSSTSQCQHSTVFIRQGTFILVWHREITELKKGLGIFPPNSDFLFLLFIPSEFRLPFPFIHTSFLGLPYYLVCIFYKKPFYSDSKHGTHFTFCSGNKKKYYSFLSTVVVVVLCMLPVRTEAERELDSLLQLKLRE